VPTTFYTSSPTRLTSFHCSTSIIKTLQFTKLRSIVQSSHRVKLRRRLEDSTKTYDVGAPFTQLRIWSGGGSCEYRNEIPRCGDYAEYYALGSDVLYTIRSSLTCRRCLCFHLHDERVSISRKRQQTITKSAFSIACLFFRLTLRP
jgi:hypothetical protein